MIPLRLHIQDVRLQGKEKKNGELANSSKLFSAGGGALFYHCFSTLLLIRHKVIVYNSTASSHSSLETVSWQMKAFVIWQFIMLAVQVRSPRAKPSMIDNI